MSEMTSVRRPGAVDRRVDGGARIVRWGALAALAAPFVALFGVAVGAPIYADELREAAGSAQFTVATATALAALVLLGLGLVALYRRQEHALGAFGTAGFTLALVGTMLAAGGAWDQTFAVPYLANEAPAVLDTATSGSLLAGYFLSFTFLALGWALFAVATRRAGVLPRRASTVLLVGAAIAFVPLPTALRLLVLAIGAALLARAAIAPASDAAEAPRAAAAVSSRA